MWKTLQTVAMCKDLMVHSYLDTKSFAELWQTENQIFISFMSFWTITK